MFIYPNKINDVIKTFSNYLQKSFGNSLKIEAAILDMTPAIIISTWCLILLLNFIIARKILTKGFIKFKDKILNLKLQSWLITILYYF